MSNKTGRLIWALATAWCLLWFNSCGNFSGISLSKRQGVIAGNPMSEAPRMLRALCEVIRQCHTQVVVSECEQAVLATGGIDTEVGLPLGAYADFSAIVQAENSGAIEPNQAAADQCNSQISQLQCSDSSVQGAYDPALPNAFSRVNQMIPQSPGSCSALFDPGTIEYYVATGGSDTNGDGSSAQPWATITHAAQVLVLGPQGAKVHVGAGIYSPVAALCPQAGIDCGVYTTKSGASASARLVYVSDQKWGAKIQPTNSYSVWYNSGDYVDIIGFEMAGDGSTNLGVHSIGSFVRIMANHVHDVPMPTGCSDGNGGGGIYSGVALAHDNDSIGNLVHDIGPLLPDGLPGASYCNGAMGIGHNGARGNIQNNIVYKVATNGIQGWHAATDLNVSQNLVFNIGAMSDLGDTVGCAVLIGSGNEGGGINDNSTVSNNILRDNRGIAICEAGSTGSRNVYLNNLLFSNARDFLLKNGLVAVGTLTSDPQMVNFQSSGAGDYHLTAASPAIDQGTLTCSGGVGTCTPSDDFDGSTRPFGPALDIGPYEWHP